MPLFISLGVEVDVDVAAKEINGAIKLAASETPSVKAANFLELVWVISLIHII